jgi:hypothetical protein
LTGIRGEEKAKSVLNVLPTSAPLGASGSGRELTHELTTGLRLLIAPNATVVISDAFYGVSPKNSGHAIVEFDGAIRQIGGGLAHLLEAIFGESQDILAVFDNDFRELSVRGPGENDKSKKKEGNDRS